MEGDEQRNRKYSRTAVLEDSGIEVGGFISKCVHSELCSNLPVKEGSCNNCAPGNTLLEQEIGQTKSIVRDELPGSKEEIGQTKSIVRDELTGSKEEIGQTKSIVRDELTGSKEEIGQTKSIVRDELTGSKVALIDDHRLPKLPSTDIECFENKVIPQPSAPSSTSPRSGCKQNNAPELVSGGSGSAVGQLSNGEDLSDEKLPQESLVQQQQRKVLSHQPGTAHINSTTSEMPEAVSIVTLRDDMSFNDDLNKLSSGNDMKMRDSKSEENGCSDTDSGQTGGERLEPVSDDELPETVHVVASSSCVQGLLETEQDVSDCENEICNVPHTCITLVDTANNSTTPEAPRVSFGSSDSGEVGRANHFRGNNDLSPRVTQVGLVSLQPTSLETKCGSSHNSNETHASPQCGSSHNSNVTQASPQCGSSSNSNVTQASPQCGSSNNSNETHASPQCSSSNNSNVTQASLQCGSSNNSNETQASPQCGSSNETHASLQCAESERTIDIDSPIIVNSLPFSQDRTVELVEAGTSPATSSCRVPEMPSHCELAASESCNTFLQLKFSHKESNVGIDLPQQQASHLHIGSSEKRATNNAETVNIEDSDSSNGEHLTIELSEHNGSENMSQGSSAGNRILMTDSDNKQATENVIDLPEELDYEEGGVDTPAQSAVVDERLNGDDGQHEEGESSDRDEGELSDDDVEEGEIKEPGSKKSQLKSACPFLQKGGCTWGAACRFLHPGVNDKGNYQMLEVPGFSSPASRARLDTTDLWPKLPETLPPKVQEVPLSETAWERGLRLAREKKATERRGQEPGSEANQPGKESEQLSKFLPRLPYYDQPAYEEDVYYKSPRDLLQVGAYEDFQARHSSYQDMPSAPYVNLYSPLEKFDRNGLDQREHFRPGAAPLSRGYTPPLKRPDEWIDPWMRSKSPLKDKKPSVSRGRRRRASKSDYSQSSRSSSGSSSSSSRSSRSASNSSASSRDQSQSATAAGGPGGYDSGHYKGVYQHGGYRGGSYGGAGPGIVYAGRNVRNRSKDRFGRRTDRSTPDRPLPYARPRRKSGSDSSSSRSRSRRRKPSSRGSRSSSRSPASKGTKASQPTTKGPQPDSLPYPPFSLDQIPHPSDPRPPLPGPPAAARPESAGPRPPLLGTPAAARPESAGPRPPLLGPPAAARPESAGPKAQQASLKPKEPQKAVIQKPSVKLTIVSKQPALDSRPNPLDSPPPKQEHSDDDMLAIQPNLLDSPPSKHELSDDDVLIIQPNPQDSPPPTLELSDDDCELPIQPNPMDSPSLKRQLSDDDVIVVSAIMPAKKVNLPKSGRARKTKQKRSQEKAPLSAVKVAPSSDVPRVKAHRVKVPGGLAKNQSSKAKSQKTEAAATKTSLASSKSLKNMPTSRKELLKQLKEVEKAIARKKSQLQ